MPADNRTRAVRAACWNVAALRYTPAGIPVARISGLPTPRRRSKREAERQVECEMACVALGPAAQLLLAAPSRAMGSGSPAFSPREASSSRTPVLHVNTIEFLEGNENGIQTESKSTGEAQGRQGPQPVQASQVLPLHRREDRGDRLQGRRNPEGLHHRERQDHAGAHHRHQGRLPASAVAPPSSARASWR